MSTWFAQVEQFLAFCALVPFDYGKAYDSLIRIKFQIKNLIIQKF